MLMPASQWIPIRFAEIIRHTDFANTEQSSRESLLLLQQKLWMRERTNERERKKWGKSIHLVWPSFSLTRLQTAFSCFPTVRRRIRANVKWEGFTCLVQEFTSRFRLARASASAANLNDNNKSARESIFPVVDGNQWREKHSNGANAGNPVEVPTLTLWI